MKRKALGSDPRIGLGKKKLPVISCLDTASARTVDVKKEDAVVEDVDVNT